MSKRNKMLMKISKQLELINLAMEIQIEKPFLVPEGEEYEGTNGWKRIRRLEIKYTKIKTEFRKEFND